MRKSITLDMRYRQSLPSVDKGETWFFAVKRASGCVLLIAGREPGRFVGLARRPFPTRKTLRTRREKEMVAGKAAGRRRAAARRA